MTQLQVVLHVHQPWVPLGDAAGAPEEAWLYDALIDSYLPLTRMLQGLNDSEIAAPLGLAISPTLMAMLEEPERRRRAGRHLERRLALAAGDCESAPEEERVLAQWYLDHWEKLRTYWKQELQCDIVSAWVQLAQRGRLEPLAGAATHPFMPLTPKALWASQIALGRRRVEVRFGRGVAGFWLPECGYHPGLDEVLLGEGVRYTIIDPSSLPADADPVGRSPRGLAYFVRDTELGAPIWSAESGYASHEKYRSRAWDVGWERPLDQLRPHLGLSRRRFETGLKYRARDGQRAGGLWEPAAARAQTRDHAQVFLQAVRDRGPAIGTLALDAELLGMGWFEGPWFLEEVLKGGDSLGLALPMERICSLESSAVETFPGSWVQGSFSGPWLSEPSDWMQRHLAEVAVRLRTDVLPALAGPPSAVRQAAELAFKEALLAHASDWGTLMRAGAAYATARFEAHMRRFLALSTMVAAGAADARYLERLEEADHLFSEVDLAALVTGR